METSKKSNTVLSKTEDFININQRISLPENYKKYSTIKLRIKPAKLIFVTHGNNLSEKHNEENRDQNYQGSENYQQNLKLDPSSLFRSADCLPVTTNDNSIKNNRTIIEYQENEMKTSMDDSQPDGDSEIVKELVLGKFRDLLQRFIERSNKRRIFSTDQVENMSGWSDYMHFLDPLAFDYQSIAKEFRSTGNENNVRGCKNFGEKDEKKDLHQQKLHKNDGSKTFLSQETGTILNRQDLSSEHYFRKEYQPSYVHISEQLETVEKLQYTERKSETIDNLSIVNYSSDNENELIDNEHFHFETKLRDDINEQTTAILQVLKVLSLCDTNKKLSESVLRVEAERVLLIASIRRNILTKAFMRHNGNNEVDCNGFVLLSNLRIPLEQINESKIKLTRFFICVFRCGTTVFCSDLLVPNSQKELKIEEPFYFEELPIDFEINAEIYCMHLKIREKSSGRKIWQKYRNLLVGVRSRFRSNPEIPQKEETMKRKSAFIFIGKTVINRPKLQYGEFLFDNENTQNMIAEQLNCNISSGVKLDIFLSGFLMVCERCSGKTRWRRQWCILDASQLKFWDYPGREATTDPNRIIDLSRSLLPYIMLADRKFCSRPRSLHLKIGPDTAQEEFYHKDIFLAADNPRDFLFWERELNRVLKNLINWGCMKTYFENSI